MILFGLCQIIGKWYCVVLVDLGRDTVEPGDEGMLDGVHEQLNQQYDDAVWCQFPKALWKF